MKPVNPMDLMFLLLERRNQPMHVGGLFLAKPPEDADDTFVQELVRTAMGYDKPTPPFNQRLVSRGGVQFWSEDDEFDLESHVYHLALPKPGRVRELLALVSKLHSALLDRHKPLWEVYVIEGVEGGRIAVYSKIHHALVDGVSAMRLMERGTTAAPDDPIVPIWALPVRQKSREEQEEAALDPIRQLAERAQGVRKMAGSATKVVSEVVNSIRRRNKDNDYVSVFQAPKTLFNQRISGSRRFAAQSWPMARIRAAGKRHSATVNDIVLAMCSAALRRYLLDMDALPDKPLITMVPMSLRKDDSAGGNQIAMILADLGTQLESPQGRLESIQRSVNNSKERFARMNQAESIAYTSAVMTVHGANMALGVNPAWQAFNLVVSNVPGTEQPRYWNGALIEGIYPVSIVMDGVALNITLTSYAGNLEFGLIGCQRTVPHLQRLLQYLEEGLAELE
ncbi:MAG: wax ester/triacylglycerol synthase family O-acyltransferase [Alcanivorax sp.]|nr:wax ester/triacylglycerol synthase family O-acyltransferase [Alcanivorax sp.]